VFERISDVLHLYIQATNYLLDLIELHGVTKKLNTRQMTSIGHIKALDKSLREHENKKISD
jgi:hypothetical protein